MELALALWRVVLYQDESCVASIGLHQASEQGFGFDFVLRLCPFIVDRQSKHQLVIPRKREDDTVQVWRLRREVDREGAPRMVEATLNDMGERIRRFPFPRRFGNRTRPLASPVLGEVGGIFQQEVLVTSLLGGDPIDVLVEEPLDRSAVAMPSEGVDVKWGRHEAPP